MGVVAVSGHPLHRSREAWIDATDQDIGLRCFPHERVSARIASHDPEASRRIREVAGQLRLHAGRVSRREPEFLTFDELFEVRQAMRRLSELVARAEAVRDVAGRAALEEAQAAERARREAPGAWERELERVARIGGR